MDKLEYIPGDLVSVYVGIKKFIVKVIGVENENEVLSYQIKFPNGEIQYADKDNIVPIPLTPEILEKNGWKKKLSVYYVHPIYNIEIIVARDNPSTWFILMGIFPEERISCVSDLQHYLSSKGYESEMEV